MGKIKKILEKYKINEASGFKILDKNKLKLFKKNYDKLSDKEIWYDDSEKSTNAALEGQAFGFGLERWKSKLLKDSRIYHAHRSTYYFKLKGKEIKAMTAHHILNPDLPKGLALKLMINKEVLAAILSGITEEDVEYSSDLDYYNDYGIFPA